MFFKELVCLERADYNLQPYFEPLSNSNVKFKAQFNIAINVLIHVCINRN